MRARLADVVRHPTWFGAWWDDLPCRRRFWWKWLLLDPGQGWLRWSFDQREDGYSYWEPPEPYTVAPPLRRLWIAVRWREWDALSYLRDKDRIRGTW